ncbi:hypothetical protein BZA77DRAFT_101849 [Pyronema omphalodes]|nr:hypothetical protein BZA77DRAFT_101849 [Pyronema omphalodes]
MSPTPTPEPVATAPTTSISATPAKPNVPTTTNTTATVTTPSLTKQLQPSVQLSETPASASPDPGTSAGSSPDPSVASGSHNESPQKGKKRAYEEATPDEKYGLYKYTEANPNMKQREYAQWFHQTYGKKINQSTVSRQLQKFKKNPPTLEACISPTGSPRKSTPRKKRRPNPPLAPASAMPLATITGGAVSPGLTSIGAGGAIAIAPSPAPKGKPIHPPTPPRTDVRNTFDQRLLTFWDAHKTSDESVLDTQLLKEANRLMPNQNKDVAWLRNWKQQVEGSRPRSPVSEQGAEDIKMDGMGVQKKIDMLEREIMECQKRIDMEQVKISSFRGEIARLKVGEEK